MFFDRKNLLGMWDLRLVFWGTAELAVGIALALDDRPGWAAALLLAAALTSPLVAAPAVAMLVLVLGAAVHGSGLSFMDWLQAYWLPAAGWLVLAAAVAAALIWRVAAEVGLNRSADPPQARTRRVPPDEESGAASGPGTARTNVDRP